jgi:TRAP-type C4-dicarboxylate transport system permease small subunit
MQQLQAILGRISQYAVWIGGAALLGAAILVTIEVFLRKFTPYTIGGADEISGYAFAASTTWAYSYCLLNRANVRIDAFYNFLPRPVRAVLDVVGTILLLIYMSVLTESALGVFLESWANNSTSVTTLQTPLWIPQLLWLMGLVLFMLTLIFVALYSLMTLLRGDLAGVQRITGVRSIDEEVKDETHGMGIKAHAGEV